ncbi:helicase SNF [Robertmurraya yapensis]|uniref:Helicase SNF n=1 Tax=Bacillus yapensis TaxID=2492960 RepID=A0A431VSF2_9BACI|nr:DEAD/DEAH box helicase [Bacillus yapensis]RTR26172.1 helicase SNF [Bacillus yapensis]TKS93610.1 DEAD/DEAH box helicase [Bacillus yapensis]
MAIKLSPKIIKEMCGEISFKRGEAFYRGNKVQFQSYTPHSSEAIVKAGEDFYVKIETNKNGEIQTSCSCPTLASFQKDCQHIAAVLIAIYEKQQSRVDSFNKPEDSSLAEGLLTIFQEQPKRSSGHQLHFEDRQVLNARFICKVLQMDNGERMFGISIEIEETSVFNIRRFLEDVRDGNQSVLSPIFTYDPRIHCFDRSVDEILHQLMQNNHKKNPSSYKSTLAIPASGWKRLVPLLVKEPNGRIEYYGEAFEGPKLAVETLPLHFDFQTESSGYHLSIKGFEQIVIMDSYDCVLYCGNVIPLEHADCKRLLSLKEMLDSSGRNRIPIPKDQMDFFLEKVLPGLKKLGVVTIADEIAKRLVQTPLIPKLYLDRVKNRLLAGLEFHYGNIMINPVSNDKEFARALLVRDDRKEDEILQLMDESEFAKTDGGYFLQNEDLEYEFLHHILPKLQKLVQVYATTAIRNRIFKENSHPNIKVKVKKERTNWLEFKFEMTGIPENEIRDLLQALEEKRKYYRLGDGSLLTLETKEFEEMDRFLRSLPIDYDEIEKGLEMPVLKGITFLDSIMDSEVFSPEESFRQFIEEITNPYQFEVPKSFESILRDYQKHGYRWLKTLASYGFGGILADDMGLGKTVQSIAYIESVLSEVKKDSRPVLIVSPSAVTYNWLHEFIKFSPETRAVVVDGVKKERQKVYKEIDEIDVLIISYTLLRKDIHWFESQEFHTVFFDEAQAFKNPITQTAKSVKKIRANHRFALTGTPIENSLEELWSIYHVVFPELFQGLKNYSQLTRKQIAKRTSPFLLRRIKADVLQELPEKMELPEYVELYPEQKKLYAAYLAKLRHDTLKHLDKNTIRKNRIRILAGLTRLRQICCHPALFVDGYKGSSAKLNKLMQIVDEANQAGRRVLIFSQFTKMLELIGRQLALKGLTFFYLDGQTPAEERVGLCDRFNKGEQSFFLISLKAGGTGLNLTGADTVILYDLWWNPAVEDQAADRAYRMGQENTVRVIKMITKGTVEEKMDELQDKKRNLVQEIIDTKESNASTLTEDDIRELLMIEHATR